MNSSAAPAKHPEADVPTVMWLLALQVTTIAIAAMAFARLLFVLADILAKPRRMPRFMPPARFMRTGSSNNAKGRYEDLQACGLPDGGTPVARARARGRGR